VQYGISSSCDHISAASRHARGEVRIVAQQAFELPSLFDAALRIGGAPRVSSNGNTKVILAGREIH
jgi:hypothetical protein